MTASPGRDVRADASGKTLRRLFLTLFLRGRSSRGLDRSKAPRSIANKLLLSLAIYGAFGFIALLLLRQPTFALAIYLHAMTFIFISMYVATSAGEVLFNKEEAEILLHRPVAPRALLWAKVAVLVQVSLWLALAFNLVGAFVGAASAGWRFPVAHVLSTALIAPFCVGFIVLTYQLCLRWFGRARLEGLITWIQVLVSVGFIFAAQIVPRVLVRVGEYLEVNVDAWWLVLLPPAWFAGLDAVLAGAAGPSAWLLAATALGATAIISWLAFVRLAEEYLTGLQSVSEASAPARRDPAAADRRRGRRWTQVLADRPPLSWWLRDPAERSAFVLSAAYMFRDRDTKLRLYPGVGPILIVPFVFLFSRGENAPDFPLAFAGVLLGMVPFLALRLLRYSQQWQASDLFRVVPIGGPAALCHGARRAVVCLLALPAIAAVGLVAIVIVGFSPRLLLLLPGIVALPLYSLLPCINGNVVPLSHPTEDAKAAGRGLAVLGLMLSSAIFAGIAFGAFQLGMIGRFLIVEAVVVTGLYVWLRRRTATLTWSPIG